MRGINRFGALIATASLALSGAVLTAPSAGAAQAAPSAGDPAPANAGAGWLAGQLTNGLMHYDQFGGYDDYGLSIDAGTALAAVGGQDPAVQSIKDGLTAHVGDYIGTAGESYSGATAKLLTFVQLVKADQQSFGGVDLVTRLEGRVAAAAPITGRIEDASAYGDYANVLGQAFAADALTAAGSAKATAVTAYLLDQQCAAGYFRTDFTADKAAAVQSCDGDSSPASVDTTAVAVLELTNQASNPAVASAITKARTWLAGQQHADGAWGSDPSITTENTNSTGLAARALGDGPASQRAAQWILARQATANDGRLASDAGAVAYDDAALTTGRTDGITDATRDQFRRASAQAVPALVFLPAPVAPPVRTARLHLKRNPVRARHVERIVVRGLAPRERVKVFFRGHVVRRVHANKHGVVRTGFRVGKRRGLFFVRVVGLRSHHSDVTRLRVRR